jgi:hypothetical protein
MMRESSSGGGSMVGRSTGRLRIAAIYARVSSNRQGREQTIASQTVALPELAAAWELLAVGDLVFEDEGLLRDTVDGDGGAVVDGDVGGPNDRTTKAQARVRVDLDGNAN